MASKTLRFPSPRHAAALYASREENLVHAERTLGVKLATREDWLRIEGEPEPLARAEALFGFLDGARAQGMAIRTPDFHRITDAFARGEGPQLQSLLEEPLVIATNRRTIVPKTLAQKLYLQSMLEHPVVFGIGPAGTGKTYLAVAMAVSHLRARRVKRIILTRPAVEAGEKLGFLPGDIQAKVDPYLRPLYDALFDMIDAERFEQYLQSGIIEVAPLAFMRGRTLNDAFIILDEAQNTTPEQMKMFLTRMGFSSKMVITGDVTQIDLPKHQRSGLVEAIRILKGIEGIAFVHFKESDVVRHPLVARIIKAYEEAERGGGGAQ